MKNKQEFKVGDIVKSKFDSCIGIIVFHPDLDQLCVQIAPNVCADICDLWELNNDKT